MLALHSHMSAPVQCTLGGGASVRRGVGWERGVGGRTTTLVHQSLGSCCGDARTGNACHTNTAAACCLSNCMMRVCSTGTVCVSHCTRHRSRPQLTWHCSSAQSCIAPAGTYMVYCMLVASNGAPARPFEVLQLRSANTDERRHLISASWCCESRQLRAFHACEVTLNALRAHGGVGPHLAHTGFGFRREGLTGGDSYAEEEFETTRDLTAYI